MRKIWSIFSILLVIVLMMGVTSCGAGPQKPDITYLPEGWVLDYEHEYGTTTNYDESADFGSLSYKHVPVAGCLLYWGDIPSGIEGKENDRDALIQQAINEYGATSYKYGTMTIGGIPAGVAMITDQDEAASGYFEMLIVFVKESTCIMLFMKADPENELEMLDFIEGNFGEIEFGE
jgi:hypothetical protein